MHEVNGEPHQNCSASDVTIPLQRNWLKANPNPGRYDETKKGPFHVISYNILADSVTPEDFFPYCPRQYFKENQRFPQLIRELDHHLADIICLQEVGVAHYRDLLEPTLRNKGYRGSYAKDRDLAFGVATFFKESFFELIEEQEKEYSKCFAEEIHGQDIKGIKDRSLVNNLSRAFLLSRLRCRQSNNTICVGNTHLTFESYERMDQTTLEASLAIRYLTRYAGGADNPHILCGDFNQEPNMPGYQVLQNGCLSDKDKEYLRKFPLVDDENHGHKKNYLVDMFPDLFTHESKHLKSAYKNVTGQEVPFSNHEDMNGTMKFPDDLVESVTPSQQADADDVLPNKKGVRKMYRTNPKNYGKEVFIAALDYFWYGSDSLHCTGVLEMIDESKIEQFHSAPNIVFPSDHLLMKAEFQFAS